MAKLTAKQFEMAVRIADGYDAGDLIGKQTAIAIARHFGVLKEIRNPNSKFSRKQDSTAAMFVAMKLGFVKEVVGDYEKPVSLTPPQEWAPLFVAQRKLYKAGLSATICLNAGKTACGDAEVLMDAAGAMLVDGVALDQPGALDAKIREVIAEKLRELRELRETWIKPEELAYHLRETPAIGKRGLLNRVEAFLHIQRRERGLPPIERRKANA